MYPLDTIVACATPEGRGGVAVIRVSGPLVPSIAKKILGKLPKPRYATLGKFLHTHGQILDEGIALYFPKPKSFTGEDVLELHGHAGYWVIQHLIAHIIELGARHARPGEFSQRAFLNDKIDLTQAEAIADLIDAQSSQAAFAALNSLQGQFAKKISALVEKIITLRMYIEAAIDFVEEDIAFLKKDKISKDLNHIQQALIDIQKTAFQGSLLKQGLSMVIAGCPNVGKSSLLNSLSEKDIAIVTPIPGTTRDVLRERITLDGIPLHLIDTAGLRESIDPVEQEGIRRASQEITRADIILHVVDARECVKPNPQSLTQVPNKAPYILIRNKIDLTKETPTLKVVAGFPVISLSVKEGVGLDILKNVIKQKIGFEAKTEGVFSARQRHLEALTRANQLITHAQEQLEHYASELVAEDLRQAQRALNEITGEFTADDLLGKIFSNFCIGK